MNIYREPNLNFKKLDYRSDITLLRAAAVLGVLFYHANIDILKGGYLGVDLFFVISGYLITFKILDDLENESFKFINFYLKRARRILPALYTSIIFSIFIGTLIYLPADFQNFQDSIIYTIFFISNIYFWKSISYFDPNIDTKVLAHTWSLGIEEQFYLLIPIFLFLLFKTKLKLTKKVSFILLLSFLSYYLAVSEKYFEPITKFYLLPTRAWELFFGVIAAFTIKYFKIPKVRIISKIALLCIISSFVIFDKNNNHPGLITLLPTLGATFFIIFNDKISFNKNNKLFIITEKLGLASYSIYLFHFPIFAIDRYLLMSNFLAINQLIIDILLLTISIVVGFISWKYVENNTRDETKFSNEKLIVFCVLISLLLLFLSKSSFFKNYINDPFSYISIVNESTSRVFVDKCLITENELINAEKCLEQYSESKDNYLIVGDSTANNLYFAIEKQLDSNKTISLLSITGCPPLIIDYPIHNKNFNEEKCVNNYKLIINEINKRDFKNIFVSYDYAIFEYFENELNFFENTLLDFNKGLANLNTNQITIIGQPITWKNKPINIISAEIKLNMKLDQYDYKNLTENLFFYEKKMKDFSIDNGYRYISLVNIFCNDNFCKMMDIDNNKFILYFSDTIHLTINGVAVVTKNIDFFNN